MYKKKFYAIGYTVAFLIVIGYALLGIFVGGNTIFTCLVTFCIGFVASNAIPFYYHKYTNKKVS